MDVTTLDRPAPAAAPIDPRIRARRIQVQRVQGHRRLRRLVDVGLVLTVLAGFVAALWTPLLDVDEVRVGGALHTGESVVAATSGIRRGDRLAAIDLGAAGRQVAALPWIQEVRLHRELGGTVSIAVTERTPVASVEAGGEAFWADAEGRVLGPAGELAPGSPPLVELDGVSSVPPVGGYLDGHTSGALALASIAQRTVPGRLSSVRAEQLTAALADGGEVRFGDATELAAKVRSLRTVLDQVDLTCLGVIDLRLPDHPVLTREERCS